MFHSDTANSTEKLQLLSGFTLTLHCLHSLVR